MLSRPLIGNPAGSEEDGGGFDLRNTLGEAACRADIAYLTDQPATLVALVRSAFGVGVINRLALQTTSTEGLTIRTVASPTAHREVALHWTRRRADSAVVKAFLDAQQQVPLPPGVQPIPDRTAGQRRNAASLGEHWLDGQRTVPPRHAAPAGNENSAIDSGLIRVEAPGADGAW